MSPRGSVGGQGEERPATTGEEGKILVKNKMTMKRSYSIENGYSGRTRSLVGDAKFESLVRRESRLSLIEAAKELAIAGELEEADDEEVFLLETLSDNDYQVHVRILIMARDPLLGLTRIMKILESEDCKLEHLESRKPKAEKKENNIQMEFLLSCQISRERILHLMKSLKTSNGLAGARLLSGRRIGESCCWFPRHISELDLCNNILTKLEPELDMDHPGWSDHEYRKRRKMIADISFNYKYGDKIPHVEYTKEEIETWDAVYSKVHELLHGRASSTHVKYLKLMEQECGYGLGKIPQLEEVSNFLKRTSGFSLRPAAGLVTARDFLSSLAFRVFQCTQYVRHPSSPHYSPEPDALHELIGHCPMFADPEFAQFSQEIGLASLGAKDEEIEKLATLYWFTVEFGLCKEGGAVRAYGAGLLSSYGELLHALSQKPSVEYRPFEPMSASVQEYDDQAYQNIYYVAESIDDAKMKLRSWVMNNLSRPFTVRYIPFTQNIEVLDSFASTNNLIQELKAQVNQLSAAFDQIETKNSSVALINGY